MPWGSHCADRLAVKGRRNKERQEDIRAQADNRVDKKSKGSNSCRLFVKLVEFLWRHVGIFLEIWLYINVANVRRRVEQKREESDPGTKLYLAHSHSLWWQPL